MGIVIKLNTLRPRSTAQPPPTPECDSQSVPPPAAPCTPPSVMSGGGAPPRIIALDTSTIFVNDESTGHLHRWHSNGRKKLRSAESSCPRRYYCCSEHLRTNCMAKKHVTQRVSGTSVEYKYPPFPLHPPLHFDDGRNTHNHPPPPNPRIRVEVKEQAVAQLAAGTPPAVLHREVVNSAPLPLSSADVPSLAQLRNWKFALSTTDLPTGMHSQTRSHAIANTTV